MSRSDLPEDWVEVWPENWTPFVVFERMGTQWRTSAYGATGLDYGVLGDVMRLSGVRKKRVEAVFQDVRAMEAEALRVMSESLKSD